MTEAPLAGPSRVGPAGAPAAVWVPAASDRQTLGSSSHFPGRPDRFVVEVSRTVRSGLLA